MHHLYVPIGNVLNDDVLLVIVCVLLVFALVAVEAGRR
jgi:hypothetical protein